MFTIVLQGLPDNARGLGLLYPKLKEPLQVIDIPEDKVRVFFNTNINNSSAEVIVCNVEGVFPKRLNKRGMAKIIGDQTKAILSEYARHNLPMCIKTCVRVIPLPDDTYEVADNIIHTAPGP